MKTLLKPTLAALTAVAFSVTSYAYPTLTISDGTTTVVVNDNSAGGPGTLDDDVNAAAGAVTFIGAVGVFTINVDTGLTKPVIGSTTDPHMDLNFVTSATGAGTLTLTFEDNNFSYIGGLLDQIGGTLSGPAGSTVSDVILKNGNTVTSLGPFAPGAYSGSTSAGISLVPGDVLALQVVINMTGPGTASGDKEGIPVPDGGTTLLLLGAALSGLGLINSRKLAKKA